MMMTVSNRTSSPFVTTKFVKCKLKNNNNQSLQTYHAAGCTSAWCTPNHTLLLTFFTIQNIENDEVKARTKFWDLKMILSHDGDVKKIIKSV